MKTKFIFIICYSVALVIAFTFSCSSPPEPIEVAAATHTLSDTTRQFPVKTEVPIPSEKEKKAMKESTTPLTIIVNNLASPTAPVVIGVYNSTYRFLYKEGRLNEYTFIPKDGKLTALITDIPYGVIAIGIYQDMNNNSAFDKNSLGLPKEGYAFSNNVRPRIKAPEFDECKFNYSAKENCISIDLIK